LQQQDAKSVLKIYGRHLELTKVPQSWLMKIYQSCLGFPHGTLWWSHLQDLIKVCIHLYDVIGKRLYNYHKNMYAFHIVFSSPCQRQYELLHSLGVRRPLTFDILIFSSAK
jgi:hypothetical protein